MDKNEKDAWLIQIKKCLYEIPRDYLKDLNYYRDKMMQAMEIPKWMYEIPIEEDGEKITIELEIDEVEENKDERKSN